MSSGNYKNMSAKNPARNGSFATRGLRSASPALLPRLRSQVTAPEPASHGAPQVIPRVRRLPSPSQPLLPRLRSQVTSGAAARAFPRAACLRPVTYDVLQSQPSHRDSRELANLNVPIHHQGLQHPDTEHLDIIANAAAAERLPGRLFQAVPTTPGQELHPGASPSGSDDTPFVCRSEASFGGFHDEGTPCPTRPLSAAAGKQVEPVRRVSNRGNIARARPAARGIDRAHSGSSPEQSAQGSIMRPVKQEAKRAVPLKLVLYLGRANGVWKPRGRGMGGVAGVGAQHKNPTRRKKIWVGRGSVIVTRSQTKARAAQLELWKRGIMSGRIAGPPKPKGKGEDPQLELWRRGIRSGRIAGPPKPKVKVEVKVEVKEEYEEMK